MYTIDFFFFIIFFSNVLVNIVHTAVVTLDEDDYMKQIRIRNSCRLSLTIPSQLHKINFFKSCIHNFQYIEIIFYPFIPLFTSH